MLIYVNLVDFLHANREASSNPERCCIYMVCGKTHVVRKQQKHPYNIKQISNPPVKLPSEELEYSIGGFNGG